MQKGPKTPKPIISQTKQTRTEAKTIKPSAANPTLPAYHKNRKREPFQPFRTTRPHGFHTNRVFLGFAAATDNPDSIRLRLIRYLICMNSPLASPFVALSIGILHFAAGCGSTPQREPRVAESSISVPETGRPVAIVGGQRLERSSLSAALAEAAGAVVLEETVLDAALAREIGAPLSTIGREDLDRERRNVLAMMIAESGMTEAEAIDQLERSRVARGLGPHRFDALLRRNVALRRSVASDIVVTPDELRLARDVNFGDRVRAHLIVVRSEREAEQLRQRLAAGADFEALAKSRSIDPSGAQGGLIPSVSWQDPVLPLPLQAALRTTEPGQLSAVIAMDGGSAIVRVDQRLGATGSSISDSELESRIRLRKERVAMDATANRLLAATSVTVFDESLRWAWETRGR